jgi:hypothetical protein
LAGKVTPSLRICQFGLVPGPPTLALTEVQPVGIGAAPGVAGPGSKPSNCAATVLASAAATTIETRTRMECS